MKGFDFMTFNNDMLVNLMLICASPIYTIEDAERCVKAIAEINSRRRFMTVEDDNSINTFLQYCEIYHSTKKMIYLNKAINIIAGFTEDISTK